MSYFSKQTLRKEMEWRKNGDWQHLTEVNFSSFLFPWKGDICKAGVIWLREHCLPVLPSIQTQNLESTSDKSYILERVQKTNFLGGNILLGVKKQSNLDWVSTVSAKRVFYQLQAVGGILILKKEVTLKGKR